MGEYNLPSGSVIVAAGNRAEDNALVRPMSSALVNRLIHVQLRVSASDWLDWAGGAGLHPLILEYVRTRPDHLWSKPPKTEEPFSTPRSWHMLSDALGSYGDDLSDPILTVLAHGTLSAHHATQFRAYSRVVRHRYGIERILKGEAGWPAAPEERDVLYFLAQSFRARLVKELPEDRALITAPQRDLVHVALARIRDLAQISLEIAQMVVGESEDGTSLPDWLRIDIVRVLPRLAAKASA